MLSSMLAQMDGTRSLPRGCMVNRVSGPVLFAPLLVCYRSELTPNDTANEPLTGWLKEQPVHKNQPFRDSALYGDTGRCRGNYRFSETDSR